MSGSGGSARRGREARTRQPSAAEARAAAQAEGRVRAERRAAELAEAFADRPDAGRDILRASLWGTAAFVLSASIAAVSPDLFEAPSLVLSLLLATLGVTGFVWGFLQAVGRSRYELVSLGSLVTLSGCAPPRVRRLLLGCLAVQVVTGITTAAIRPYTALAFGTLVPMFGLATTVLWAARHGEFVRRPDLPDVEDSDGSA